VAEGKRKTQERSLYSTPSTGCWSSFIGYLFSGLLPSVYLYGHHMNRHIDLGLRFGAIRSVSTNIDEEYFLDIRIVFQSACNMMMYSVIF
jgi:hypothetical protein